jgi:hypothetical protein
MVNRKPHRFTHQKKNPDNHQTGGWVGPRAGLDVLKKKNLYGDSNPVTSIQ